ncbi:MAG TPA: flavodoxin [Firmicutes bacterium]|nr:flavodoxin [Bacillota bacterium]
MKKWRRMVSSLLAAALLLTAVPTVWAAEEDTGFSDVAADAWYAGAVEYVRDNGLMSGTGSATFSPNAATSRAMLATVLYRAAGSPAAEGTAAFSDVAADAWYADAVAWASENGIVSGYGNGLFGTNDPVSREQIATILWRYEGSPSAESGQDFADESAISGYASTAVDWARANGIISGREGNVFDPKGNATRAEVAAMLQNDLTRQPDGETQPDGDAGDVLVVYFSGTGNTEAVAQTIASTLDADLFELEPADPYTDEDLDWTVDGSRVNQEHENEALQAVELTADTVENWEEYDTVFIGYPIWWGIAAWPVNDFIQANDFTGKTVVPFCTSASSGLGQSAERLEQMAGSGTWLEGRRFSQSPSQQEVQSWVESLDLPADSSGNSPAGEESRALVVYFSIPETDDPQQMTTEEANSTVVIDGQVLGNTQYMAQVIQQATGADLFRIEPAEPYPTDHETMVALAADEQEQNARPAIQGQVEDLEAYDRIYIGYPIWWGDMPMILYTFFDQYDLSGKTIVPFGTHGGSGFAGTPDTIEQLEPQATVLEGLTISRDQIQDAEQQIVDWVNGLPQD